LNLLLVIFLLIAFAYFTLLHFVFWGLKRLRIKEKTTQPHVSVVIAARNESRRIVPTLDSLLNLDYPLERYEVIFVDDGSTDDTARVIESYVQKQPNWKLIRLRSREDFASGKKRALKEGIQQARGTLIFTTDADCRVPSGWLKYMSAYFEPQVAMVLGYSPLKRMKGPLNLLLQFDNLYSAIMAAAPTMWGFPLTSVGRNLAYRKDVYMQVGGFDALKNHRSGDDVYLTERFRLKSGYQITFCAHPQTFVETLPPTTFTQFWHQQIRKNSKTLRKSWDTTLFSLLGFLVYAYLWLLPVLAPELLLPWAMVIVLKLFAEFITLRKAAVLFRKKWLIPYLPFFQILYPLYITFFTLLGLFQAYQWKK